MLRYLLFFFSLSVFGHPVITFPESFVKKLPQEIQDQIEWYQNREDIPDDAIGVEIDNLEELKKLIPPSIINELPLPTPEPPKNSVIKISFGQNIPNVLDSFIDDLIREDRRFSREELRSYFARVKYQPSIIRALDAPSTSTPWFDFKQKFVNPLLIDRAQNYFRKNAKLLREIQERYKVDSKFLVAIMAIESNFGLNQGKFRAMDALSTISFYYPRRSKFFRNELKELLILAKNTGRDPFSFRSSYAGAMGIPQFLPSSFNKFAVDYDSDGFKNIWSDHADALASIANYLRHHGWLKNGTLILDADVAKLNDSEIRYFIDDVHGTDFVIKDFRKRGISFPRVSNEDSKALLFRVQNAPGEWNYYLGLQNFYVITLYNRSINYAMSVYELAGFLK